MEKIKEYLKKELTTEELRDMVTTINNYDFNEKLNYLNYYDNDESFFEMFFENKTDVAKAICFGNYNYYDCYVKFNDYGNIESCNECDYDKKLEDSKNDIIDCYLELYEQDKYYLMDDDIYEKIVNFLEETKGDE